MEDADATNPATETLDAQFAKVKTLTAQSHVMRYGDLDFKTEPVGNFYGNMDLPTISSTEKTFFNKLFVQARQLSEEQVVDSARSHITATSSRDIKLHHLYATVSTKKSHAAQLDLSYEITRRMRVDHTFESFAESHGLSATDAPVLPRNFDCLKTLVSTYDSSCGKLEDYSLQYVKYFVQACESLTSTDYSQLTAKIVKSCSH